MDDEEEEEEEEEDVEEDFVTTEDTLASMSNSMSVSSRCTPPLTNASRRCRRPAQHRRVARFFLLLSLPPADAASPPSAADDALLLLLSSTSMRTLRSPREHSFKAASINTAAKGATAIPSSALIALPSSWCCCIFCCWPTTPELDDVEAEVEVAGEDAAPKRLKMEVIPRRTRIQPGDE